MKREQSGILSDHKQEGKTFLPPFKHLMGGFSEIHYVERIIPEIAWIQYLLKGLGEKRGIAVALGVLKAICQLKDWGKAPEFSYLSLMKEVSKADWMVVREKLREQGFLSDAISGLSPFLRAYPTENPLAGLCGDLGDFNESDITTARSVLDALFDRRSKEGSIAQSVIVHWEIESGKVTYTENVPLPNLNAIFTDFESEEAVRACAHVRMSVNQIFQFYRNEIGEQWAKYFWNRGKVLSPVHADLKKPAASATSNHPFYAFALDYERHVKTYLEELWRKLPVNLYESEEFEVIGALLGRQCNLAVLVCSKPSLWDFYGSPLFLRALVDTYISAAWILRDPLVRARGFISYGLGQEKLLVEHYKAELTKMTDEDDRKAMMLSIQAREAWIDSQHFTFLQEVDIGSWSGLNTRKMAEEAGCMDLYRFAYTPWSHAAHGIWNHIGRFDARPSGDSLHKHIRQPSHLSHQEFDVVVNATKYLNKLFRLVATHYKLTVETESPFDWLDKRAPQLFSEIEAKDSSEKK